MTDDDMDKDEGKTERKKCPYYKEGKFASHAMQDKANVTEMHQRF